MQLKTHVSNEQTFVATPYRAGTFVRSDIFWRQFTITCQGNMECPEDDPVYGTWLTPHTLVLGQHGLIEDAMALASAHLSTHQFESDSTINALDFIPELVLVRDALDRLVLAGQARGELIHWCEPVGSDSEAASVVKQVDELRSEASYEAGWDNFSTAERLRLSARVLAGRLVDPYWRKYARGAFQTASPH